ncbi:HVO_0649 family zinc finger protein [Halalkalirubrum salinum]|uniref:HVO_0649 family zinc finger protein n=1 Tax=Halalkalirubrum salinum TaxID=2563889 RepID=UPI0010FBB7E2|nr:HVO_0649 family zinc finger protein [Halalkalirubrum salinum]
MSSHIIGMTALDRYKMRLDKASRTCPACGYDDTDGEWQAVTTGSRVQYRHVCPSCGSISTRELRLRRT